MPKNKSLDLFSFDSLVVDEHALGYHTRPPQKQCTISYIKQITGHNNSGKQVNPVNRGALVGGR